MSTERRLWIDTTGQPVITTTPNGVKNATRWGWTEAKAVPLTRDAEVAERIAQVIEVKMRQHDRAQVGFSAVGDAYADAARIAREAGRA